MIGTAFSLAIVGYVINLAMGRTLAAKHGYDVDPNQVTLGLAGHGPGPFPLLSGVKGNPCCVVGKVSDVLCFKQTCCSRACRLGWQLARSGAKGRGRSISHGLERACEREESLRLSSLLCSPPRPSLSPERWHRQHFCRSLEHNEAHVFLTERRKTWIPGVSPRYCERQDIK